ncbi:chromosomal replication initiator protein DnaA [Sulfuricurvum sp.]|uniref:chromosomal replication initiator protein DnaA n=1 Tax=Sulfuricurvum sp. TaxID=2025608 RepID=UPI002635F10F|nr:chromosomal replication initiator protein DnaA [Sulfuricurvum sp.]MDD3595895.1 chromosomal replication initiator protein DnaA [Sulfuricurvum sp.]
MDKKISNISELIIKELEKRIKPIEFKRYIKQLKYNESLSNIHSAVFEAPNALIANWAQAKYAELIATLFEMKTNIKPAILFRISDDEVLLTSFLEGSKAPKISTIGSPLNPLYTFENFIVGGSNEFAYRAAIMASKKPGIVYNPLFIHGGVGLGKTHLMHAVGNVLKDHGKDVIYTSVENFLNDFSRYLRIGEMEQFKNKYRKCDLLLIDDVQFLSGKVKVQEEFFHTFEALKNENRQIIITSDQHPKKIAGIEKRLISRFEWGLVADIQPPELDTKLEIIKKKCEINRVSFSNDIIQYIATIIENNTREIEGIITKLNAYSQLMGIEVDLEFARSVMKNQIEEKKTEITIDSILEMVAKELNVKQSEMRSNNRTVPVVQARRIAIYLSRTLTPNSMPQLASYFGLKDHTAVSHTMKKIKAMIETDDDFKLKIHEMINKVSNI